MNIDILLEKNNISYPDRLDYHLMNFLKQAGMNIDDYILCTSHFQLELEEMAEILVPEKIIENDLAIKEDLGGILAFPSQGIFHFKDNPDFKYITFKTVKVVPIIIECLMIPIHSEKRTFLESLVRQIAEFEKRKREYRKERKNYINRLFLADNIREEIIDKIKSFLENRDFYIRHKLPWKMGILFYGPTGNGKTLFIKAISEYFGINAIDLITSIRNKKLNIDTTQEKTVFLARQECYRMAYNSPMPEIYYLEDLDKRVFSEKGSDIPTLPLNQLLQTLDGVDELNDAIIIATSNYVKDLIDAIIVRPGRFDIVQEISKPTRNQIKKLLEYYDFKCGGSDLLIDNELKNCSMAFIENFIKNCIFKYKRNEFRDSSEVKDVIDAMHKHLKLKEDFSNKLGFT